MLHRTSMSVGVAMGLLLSAAWPAFILLASFAWYLTATRLTGRFGPDAAASAVGLGVAIVVALTMARWWRQDRRESAMARGLCPRCGEGLAARHTHAHPGALTRGVTAWSCEGCGFSHAEALTCERCAT